MDIFPIMENHMEKETEHEIDTGRGYNNHERFTSR